MSGRRGRRTDIDVTRELEVIDRALCGEPTGAEHAPLVELTVEIRELRPEPSEAFQAKLDARLERGFARRAPARRRLGLQPAIVAASIVALAAAVALPFTLGGGRHVPARRGGGAASQFSSARAPYANGAAQSAPSAAPAIPAPLTQSSSQPAAPGGARQVERSASLDVGVSPASINATAQRVFTLAGSFHGYVQQSTVSSGQGEQGGASFDLRVPSVKLSGLISALADLGRVRSETNTTNDITDELDGTRRALTDAQAERASLLVQLKRAVDYRQAQALAARLHAAEARISNLQASLRALTGRVTYTEVALSLTPENEKKPAAVLSPGGALDQAGEILTTALAVLVLVGSAVLPIAALVAAIAASLALTRRRARERALDAS